MTVLNIFRFTERWRFRKLLVVSAAGTVAQEPAAQVAPSGVFRQLLSQYF
jgi:hypothetical protein